MYGLICQEAGLFTVGCRWQHRSSCHQTKHCICLLPIAARFNSARLDVQNWCHGHKAINGHACLHLCDRLILVKHGSKVVLVKRAYLTTLWVSKIMYRRWQMNEWVWGIGEMVLTGETQKYLERNLSQCHFVHRRHHMDWPGIGPWPPWWETGEWLTYVWTP
jgi:hypothetical protein